ncbi:MAG: Cna B-type domain-containing protein, partial [Mogibacterium sp.]|nr:Cna B-type domain-containing protein [Mogibacterium sp.]
MLNNLKRRALTLLLSLAMIITYMPTSMIAYAVDGDDQVQVEKQVEAEAPAKEEATPKAEAAEEAAPKAEPAEEAAPAEVKSEEAKSEEAAAPEEKSSEDAAKPAGEEPKADAKAEAEKEDSKAEDKKPVEYTEELDTVAVKVTAPGDAFSEKVSLVVKQLDKVKDKKEFKEAEDALAENKQTYDGILAFDIHFENSQGKEIEPDGAVSVEMTAKKTAFKGVDPDAVSNVQVTHISDEATVVADNADKAVDGTVDVQATKKSVEKIDVEFEVESFSTYTLTWGTDQKATIKWGYMNTSNQFVELEEGSTVTLDTTQSTVSLIDTFNGYNFLSVEYCAPNVSQGQGISVEDCLYKTANGWQYDPRPTEQTPNPERANVANGATIYVKYFKPGSPNQHGDTNPNVPSPTTTKTIKDNKDGTYDITLRIKGAVVPEDHSHYANVLVVLDSTRSMNGAKWTNAKAAMKALIETLSEGANAQNAGKIDYSLVTFGRSATVVQDWTKDNVAFKTTCADLNMVTTSGTNWEAGMRGALYGVLNTYPEGESAASHDPTYVIFLTDGDPNVYYSSGNETNYTNTGTTNGYSQNEDTSAEHSADEAKKIAASTYLYGIYCGDSGTTPSGDSYNRLVKVITGEGQGGQKTIAANADTIENEFKAIAQTIVDQMGASEVSADDGITELSGISANVPGKAGGYTYRRSTDGGETFADWPGAPSAIYNSENGVTWDLSEVGTVGKDDVFEITFTVWPSQEAFDIIANLNNGTMDWEDDLTDAERAQINRTGSEGNYSYSLKSNTHLNTSYTFNNNRYTDNVTNFPSQNMALVSDEINVFKHWEDDINTRNRADYVEFYLLIDGEYYQKDGTTAATTENAELLTTYRAGQVPLPDGTTKTVPAADAWKASEYIAPGLATLSGTTVTALEDGHSFKLEEKAGYKWEDGKNTYQDYSMEFASQTVRPMVIYVNGVRTVYYFVEVDADHPAVGTTYTIVSTDGSTGTYYIDDVSATITAENKKTPELDITKIIDEENSVTDLTPTQLDNEEFTYTVTFTFPKGSDPSGVGYWRYEPSDSDRAWTLGEYDSQTNYQPDNYTNGEKFYGESSTSIWGSGDSTDTSQGTLNKTVEVKLKRSEVLRFTNLPVGTEYRIVESAANDKTLASQGYTVSKINAGYTGTSGIVANSAATVTPASATVSGKTSAADTRYYHQFTNKLVAVDAELKVTKAMDYDWDKGDDNYEFTLTATGDAPLPYKNASDGNKVTVSSASELTKTFGLIRFIKAGTYTYTITETIPDPVNPAIVYGGPATVTVTVNNDLEVTNITATGTEVTSKYTPAGNDKDAVGEVTITNKWAKTSLNGKKTWKDNNNEAGKRPQEIVVNLVEKGSTTVIESVKVTADADGNWVYSFNNIPKYKLVNGELVAIEYAVTENEVTDYDTEYVEPVKNADGTFTADIINTNVVLDTNTQTFFKKTVTKANPTLAATFNFTLTEVADADGTEKEGARPVNGSVTFNKGEATSKAVDFGKIVYSKVGTYYYKIVEDEENLPDGWTVTGSPAIVTVVVELNAEKQLEVKSVTGGEIQNAYNASGTANIPVTKELVVPGDLEGPEEWEYTFTVAANGTAPTVQQMSKTVDQDNPTATFGPFTFTAP